MKRRVPRILLAAGVLAAITGAAAAQGELTAVILRGAATRPGIAPPGTPTVLTPGVRVESPQNSWTEIAFSDGSSVVLEPGADFTLQGIVRDPASGHLVIRASAGRGRLQITAARGIEVLLATPTAEVRVVAASAVVVAGQGGSATMLSGQRVAVRHQGREDVLRRPGFRVAFDDGVLRDSREQLAQALESFAPIGEGGGSVTEAALVETPAAPRRTGRSRDVGPGLNANEGQSFQVANLGSSNAGTGTGSTGGGGTGGGAGGGATNPTIGGSFTLASAVIGTGGSATGIASPGTSDATSSLDATQGVFATQGNPTPDQTDSSTNFSPTSMNIQKFTSSPSPSAPPPSSPAARVRIFSPAASPAAANRDDTGLVGGKIGDNFYQNILRSTLSPTTQSVVHDATGSAGYLALTAQTPSPTFTGPPVPSAIQPNVFIGDGATPNVACTTSFPGGPCASDAQGTDEKFTLTYPAVLRVPIGDGNTINNVGNPSTVVALPVSPTSQVPIRLAGSDPNHAGLLLYVGPNIPLCTDAICSNSVSPPAATDAPNSSAPAQLNPNVFIIDKVTASNAQIQGQRGIAPDERFFAIGGTSVGDSLTTGGLPQNGGTMPAGTVMRFAISDLLNPTPAGGLNTTQPLPQQFTNPPGGVLPAAFSAFNAFRPQETFAVAGTRGDTHLWVVAGDPGNAARPNVASRADLQITADGRSSGSVSVGTIAQLGAPGVNSLVLAGRTIGSTRLNTGQFSAAINSGVGSLATAADGQSTHLLGGAGLNNGQISYFAVSQADPRLGTTDTAANPTSSPAQIQPGTVLPVGVDPLTGASQFAYTRLATNVGPGGVTQPGDGAALQGFASGVVEHSDGALNTVQAYTTNGLGGAVINRAANANTFNANFALAPTSVGSLPSDPAAAPSPVPGAAPATLSFGDSGTAGATPQSAFVSNSTFAALGTAGQPGTSVAMTSVDGDLLKGIAGQPAATGQPVTIAAPGSGNPVDASLPASNEHLAWGYFLGDLAMQANGAIQDHVNLGFWVAGRPVGADVIQSLSGTATYGGGLIGTVVSGGIRTAVGQFAETWNFGTRSGAINAAFDGASWTGLQATMPNGSNVFSGSGLSGDRTLALQGSFFHNGTPTNAALPAAVGGAFAIHNATGSYGANGILVGTKR